MSPRPKRMRMIEKPPVALGYKPVGVPMRGTRPVEVYLEEFEAFRLADYENLNQEQAAEKMGVSRPTFTRIYDSVLKKVSAAFVEGKPIVISGGNAALEKDWYRCGDCHHMFHQEGDTIHCTTCNSENVQHVNAGLESWKCTEEGVGRRMGGRGTGSRGRGLGPQRKRE